MKTETETLPFAGLSLRAHPILFIHGLWGDKRQYKNWLPHSGNSGHALSLVGHDLPERVEGQPSGNLNGLSIEDYVEQHIRYLEQEHPGQKSHIVAHSAGTVISAIIAERRPDLVQSMVFMAGVPTAGAGRLPFKAWFLDYMLPLTSGHEFRLKPGHERIITGGAPIGNLGWESGRVAREILLAKYRVKPLSCPLLVIAASHDMIAPPKVQRKIARYHRAEYLELRGTHMFHCDPRTQPKVTETVFGWLYRNRH